MTKKTARLFGFIISLTFLSCSCASMRAPKPASPTESAPQTEAEADASLGTLRASDQSEAQKVAEELEEGDEAEKALSELRKRQARDDAERLHRSITEFDQTEQALRPGE